MFSHPKVFFSGLVTSLMLATLFAVAAPSVATAGATGAPVASPISVGGGQDCATLTSGVVECWGNDNLGQTGYFYSNNWPTPEQAGYFSDASTVSAGSNSSCAALSTGGVECWGYDYYGELGDNGASGQYTSSPVSVVGISTATDVSQGQFSTCSVLSGGSIDCWGQNASGDLGDGNQSLSQVPVPVSSITNAASVSMGSDFACALLTTGSIDCWGDNSVGELGDGGAESSSDVPVSVSSITNAVQVSAGAESACALLATGSIDCWGGNTDGDLGNGGTTQSDSPGAVSSITNATSVSVGTDFACATLSTGAVDCWGNNSAGELGNAGTAQSDVPVTVSSITGVTAVGSGSNNSCAVETNKTVWCWGSDGTDQLGYAPTSSNYSDVPIQISNLSAATPAVIYAVTYNPEGGSVSPTSGSYTVGGSSLTLPTPTRVGYAFNGWYSAPSGGSSVSSPYTPSGSTTIYAQWTANTYVVTYNSEGGSVTPTSGSFTVGGSALTLPTPTLTGYAFNGWYSAPSGGSPVSSPYTPTTTTSIYAQWTANTYVVTYNSEGGSVTPSSGSFTVGGSALTLPTPTFSGHTFQGWYTAPTGGTSVTSPYSPSAAVTLYAHWLSNKYVVSFDPEGGSVTPTSGSFSVGGSPLALPTPTYVGYTFNGWFTSATGGSMLASPYLPFSSVTLYAQWTADVFIVTFDARGGTVSTHTATFTVGGSPVDLPTPRLAGRTFEGWYTASSGGQRVSGPLSPTSAETLFAQWSQKAPSSPTDLRSSRTKNQIIVRWSSDAGATSYTCTLVRGTPRSIKVTTKSDQCIFSARGVAKAYEVSVVANDATGASRSSSVSNG
jgi:uncharacterized repeat protein (TIGR02543 family)